LPVWRPIKPSLQFFDTLWHIQTSVEVSLETGCRLATAARIGSVSPITSILASFRPAMGPVVSLKKLQ